MNDLLAILVGFNITIVVIGQVLNNKRLTELENKLESHDCDTKLVSGQNLWILRNIKDTTIEVNKSILKELTVTKDEIKKKAEEETRKIILNPYKRF